MPEVLRDSKETPIQQKGRLTTHASLIGKIEMPNAVSPSPDQKSVTEYGGLYSRLMKAHPNLKLFTSDELQKLNKITDALDGQSSLSLSMEDIDLIAKSICLLDQGQEKKAVSQDINLEQVRDWAYVPKLIEKYKTVNCSGAAAILTAVLKKMGVEAYFANPNGHATTVVKQGTEYYYIDPRNFLQDSGNFRVRLNNPQIATSQNSRILLLRTRDGIPGSNYSLIPLYASLADALNQTIAENHEEMKKRADGGGKAEALAMQEIGASDFDRELHLPKLPEIEKLKQTEEWKKEETDTNISTGIDSGFKAFADSYPEPYLGNLLTRVKDENFNKLMVGLFTTKPSDMRNYVEAIKTIEEQQLAVELFIKAHGAFWKATEPMRLASPDFFMREVERSLSSRIETKKQ